MNHRTSFFVDNEIIIEVPPGTLKACAGRRSFSYLVGKGGLGGVFSWLQSATSPPEAT